MVISIERITVKSHAELGAFNYIQTTTATRIPNRLGIGLRERMRISFVFCTLLNKLAPIKRRTSLCFVCPAGASTLLSIHLCENDREYH